MVLEAPGQAEEREPVPRMVSRRTFSAPATQAVRGISKSSSISDWEKEEPPAGSRGGTSRV